MLFKDQDRYVSDSPVKKKIILIFVGDRIARSWGDSQNIQAATRVKDRSKITLGP